MMTLIIHVTIYALCVLPDERNNSIINLVFNTVTFIYISIYRPSESTFLAVRVTISIGEYYCKFPCEWQDKNIISEMFFFVSSSSYFGM